MLEEAEAERTTPLAEGAAVTGAAPSGTRHRQPRMPQASLFGAVGTVVVCTVLCFDTDSCHVLIRF